MAEEMNVVDEINSDKIYTIKIGGDEISARLNGNVYKVEGDVPDDVVAQDDIIHSMKIDDTEFKDQKCVNKWKENGEDITNLVFRDLTQQEKKEETLKAQIEFLSMMNDIDW